MTANLSYCLYLHNWVVQTLLFASVSGREKSLVVRRDKCIMFGVTLTLCWLGSGLPGAVCRGAPEESGPAGVTLLNLIGETKLTNAVDSNPILFALHTHTQVAEDSVSMIFSMKNSPHVLVTVQVWASI